VGIIRKFAKFSLRSTSTKYVSLDFPEGEIHTVTYNRTLGCQLHCPFRLIPHIHTFTDKLTYAVSLHCPVRLNSTCTYFQL
jgi:hypothetical protein